MTTAFNPTDVIFATVRQRGTVLANLRMSGISSMADIISRLPHAIGRLMGITTIDLRNGTQGWQRRHTIMLTA
jgi:hypothetical protein